MYKTFTATPETIRREWYLIDATDKTLGRLSTEIARRLRGKHKAEYTPHMDTGDYVVVINADKIKVTGHKATNKIYYSHSGYVGSLKSATFNEMQRRAPGRVLEIAVRGMMPKGPLGRQMLRKMKIYAGAEHQHTAQQPIPLEI